ncbi:GTP cyclohydrolase II [Geoglobus acetivorans]|uniref:GTP cyclohydrolase-2 n=2 Tax=Geoglobus acetivorans TaxID=565033 RepID=A0A0A7GFT7_GEOAI|nr:GTP cyclohydrolase II [Geoglobus acetivorans]
MMKVNEKLLKNYIPRVSPLSMDCNGTVIHDGKKAIVSFPAELVDTQSINLLMKNCDRIILAMPWKNIVYLGLNRYRFYDGRYIPVDYRDNGEAGKKAEFIRKLAEGKIKQDEIIYPGNIFVEEVKENGVLERPFFGEASIDVSRLNNLKLTAVYGYLMNEDGSYADPDFARDFADEKGFEFTSIQEIIDKRLKGEKLVRRVVEATLPTKFYGTFRAVGYETPLGEIVALVRGSNLREVPVRIHSECLTGDIFHSLRCDCGEQLEKALKKIDVENRGVLIYMRGHEGRGIGLLNKLMAYRLQEDGKDTVEANLELGFPSDMRSYGIAAQILLDLGVKKVRLMTNNPEKIEELKAYGFEVVREPIEIEPHEENYVYLKTKKEKMGHMICIND